MVDTAGHVELEDYEVLGLLSLDDKFLQLLSRSDTILEAARTSVQQEIECRQNYNVLE